MKMQIGFLHPGAMGIFLAATVQDSGHTACWASEGRSSNTLERAQKYSLVDMVNLKSLCDNCQVIVSICPPHAAEDMADQVLSCGFKGLYLDANAISPERVKSIGSRMTEAGVTFVDGGVVGVPTTEAGKTWLYLSGKAAEEVAVYFSGGLPETIILDEMIGNASALKMCYAANTKGTIALLCAILAVSEAYGVRDALEKQWARTWPTFIEDSHKKVMLSSPKAWRWTGEMAEISQTFMQVGIPGDFHKAAGEIYRRMAEFKGVKELPTLETILKAAAKNTQ